MAGGKKTGDGKKKSASKKRKTSSGPSLMLFLSIGVLGAVLAFGGYVYTNGGLESLSTLFDSPKPTAQPSQHEAPAPTPPPQSQPSQHEAPAPTPPPQSQDDDKKIPEASMKETQEPEVNDKPIIEEAETVEKQMMKEAKDAEVNEKPTASDSAKEEPPQRTEETPKAEKKATSDEVGKVKKKRRKSPMKRPLQQPVGKKDRDYAIVDELRAADRDLQAGKLEEALSAFSALFEKTDSTRAKYGEGTAYEALSEREQSNDRLSLAIRAYKQVCRRSGTPLNIRKAACLRLSDRLSFFGKPARAAELLEEFHRVKKDDVDVMTELSLQYLISGQNAKASKHLQRILTIDPENGFALGHYGFILKLELKYEEAVPYLFAGLRGDDDRSREGRFYYHLGDALYRLNRSKEAYEVYAEGAAAGHYNSMWQRSTYNAPNLKAQPWWTAKELPYAKDIRRIEKNWKTIRDEGLAVLDVKRGGFVPEEENLRQTGDWSQFTLFQQGRVLEENCRRVPKTCELMKKIPEASGCTRGQVKYSIMHPGTIVWPHCGPTNCRLRHHLGLVVPDNVFIKCGNVTRTWEEGKIIIFDDSFEHEVQHHGDSFRLVFIIDFWHPDLTEHQKKTLAPI